MKLTAELALKQSLALTQDMRLAIDMLSMTNAEIDDLIDEELKENALLAESEVRSSTISSPRNSENTSAFDVALNTVSGHDDFRTKLVRQIGEGAFNILEREIAYRIIHNLDDDGLLESQQEIYVLIGDELGVFDEWIESVRRRVMDLEPLGCGAVSVQEAIIHQAKRRCRSPHQEFLELLDDIKANPERKISFSSLSRMKNDKALSELKMLNPRPSCPFSDVNSALFNIFPEIAVTYHNGQLVVSLIKKPSERVVINNAFKLKLAKTDKFMRDHNKRAEFLLKALKFREQGLKNVSAAIVAHQSAWFLSQGELKPLVLHDIANVCGIHESSVSRLVRGKYLSCEKGVFELKDFFSAKIVRDDQDDIQSAASIKNQIKNIVGKEDKTAPLSDEGILAKLKEGGFSISRRTVAKYRESLNIGSAHERRRL